MSLSLELFRLAVNACGTKTGIFPSLYDQGSNSGGTFKCTGGNIEISSLAGMLVVAGNLLRIIIFLAGSLAVVALIVGGIYYVTSLGDPGRIKRAKDIIINTIVGLVICTTSYALVTYIAGGF